MVLTFHKNTNNNQHTNHFHLGVLFFITKHFNMLQITPEQLLTGKGIEDPIDR